MKEQHIKKYFDTRAKLEAGCRNAGLNDKGSRAQLEERLKGLSYKKLIVLKNS